MCHEINNFGRTFPCHDFYKGSLFDPNPGVRKVFVLRNILVLYVYSKPHHEGGDNDKQKLQQQSIYEHVLVIA